MTPERLFKTKAEIARSLPIGTWFVWPGPQRQQFARYLPKIYCVEANHLPGPFIHSEFALWSETEGPYSPQAAYARASEIADALNVQHTDSDAARAYVQVVALARQRDAVMRLPDNFFPSSIARAGLA